MRRPKLAGGLVAWAAYLLFTLIIFSPLLFRVSSHILADDGFRSPGRSDAYDFLWTYWWIQKSVLAWKNIYECDWVFPPAGANLYFHTHVILPTILTLPLGLLLGPVGGFNSMIVLMLSGGAAVYRAFLRHTIRLTPAASFIGGGLFGFSPYFVFKTHAHINMVGAVFWAGCLAVLVHAYLRNQFGWRRGLLFSLCLWATFWTSFVECFALLVACAVVVVVFEVWGLRTTPKVRVRDRLAFFAMAIPGAVSLWSMVNATSIRGADMALATSLRLVDLLAAPRLSIAWRVWASLRYRLAGPFSSTPEEYWGSHLPVVFVVLAVLGAAALRKGSSTRKETAAVSVVAVVLFVFALDPFQAPSTLIRLLPMGSGFRVFGRFLPFSYFFLLVLAGHGVECVLAWRSRAGAYAWGCLALLAFVELYPWHLAPMPVKQFIVPDAVAADGARGVFTLVVPRAAFNTVDDTYQVSMNVPVVQRTYLSREDDAITAARVQRFPLLYADHPELSAGLLEEMRAAHVGYVLFEDKRQYAASTFAGETVAEAGGAILVRYR